MSENTTNGTTGESQTTPPGADETSATSETPVFETWITNQTPEIKSMLDSQTRGLKTALDNERSGRKELERQIRDLAGKAEKGSEAQSQLTEMADKMSDLERRAAFYEQAASSGVINPRLAYLAAAQDELIDRHGRVDIAGLKSKYPELFTTVRIPTANAGSGTNQPPKSQSMNDFIRKAAGRS
jgi:TolA-binding protein